MNSPRTRARLRANPKPAKARRNRPWRADTIRQKIVLGFFATLIFVVLQGAAALWGFTTVGSEVSHVQGDSMVAMTASHFQRLGEISLHPAKDYLLSGDPAAEERFTETSSELESTMAELSHMMGGGEGIHIHD
ncbi:MAG: hypothetical protein ACE5M4_13875 [Anaerolineales bacterium]